MWCSVEAVPGRVEHHDGQLVHDHPRPEVRDLDAWPLLPVGHGVGERLDDRPDHRHTQQRLVERQLLPPFDQAPKLEVG